MIERSGFVHKEIHLCALSLSSAASCNLEERRSARRFVTPTKRSSLAVNPVDDPASRALIQVHYRLAPGYAGSWISSAHHTASAWLAAHSTWSSSGFHFSPTDGAACRRLNYPLFFISPDIRRCGRGKVPSTHILWWSSNQYEIMCVKSSRRYR